MTVVKHLWIEENIPNKPGRIDVEIEAPSLDQIMDAIARMDGKVTSYVMLFPTEEPGEIFLAIGGGQEGKFIVKHWDGVEGVEHNVINPAVSSDETVEVPMAHMSPRRASEIVDLATAQKVATVFATTGKLAEDVHWEKL